MKRQALAHVAQDELDIREFVEKVAQHHRRREVVFERDFPFRIDLPSFGLSDSQFIHRRRS
jgi:hypothetical protein